MTEYFLMCLMANWDLKFESVSEFTKRELIGHLCNVCCQGDIFCNLYYRWYKNESDEHTLKYVMKIMYDKEWKNEDWHFIKKEN